MDDSGTSALIGAVKALRRMFYGSQEEAVASDSESSPADEPKELAKEKPMEDLHIPAGYCTDSMVADMSRPRARRPVTRGHPQYPERRITKSAGAEMKWVDRMGPPVLKRLPDLPALAQIPVPTQVPALRGVPPLGGQARGGEEKARRG